MHACRSLPRADTPSSYLAQGWQQLSTLCARGSAGDPSCEPSSDDSSQAPNSSCATDVVGSTVGAGELSQPNQRFSMAGQPSHHTTTPACTTTLPKPASSGKLASLSTQIAGRAAAAPRLARACSAARARAASVNLAFRLVYKNETCRIR